MCFVRTGYITTRLLLHSETGQLFAYAEIEEEARWNAIAQTPTCRR
jgi:L-rhamnose mutarotase